MANESRPRRYAYRGEEFVIHPARSGQPGTPPGSGPRFLRVELSGLHPQASVVADGPGRYLARTGKTGPHYLARATITMAVNDACDLLLGIRARGDHDGAADDAMDAFLDGLDLNGE